MGLWKKVGGLGGKVTGGAKKIIGLDQAKENLTWMASIGRTLLPSSIKAGRVETFEHAMQRQGVGEEDLEKIYLNHVLKFWICVIMLFVGWGVALSYVLSGHWVALLPALGFTAICFSQMFVASFRAHQIGQRKFCDVSEWLGDIGLWVPATFSLPPAKAPQARRSEPATIKKQSMDKGKK